MKGLLEQSGAGVKLLQLVLLTFFSLLLFTMLSLLVTGGDLSTTSSLKLAQLLQSIGLFIVPPIVLAILWSHKPLSMLKADKAPALKESLMVVVVMWAAIPAINLLGTLNQSIQLPDALSGMESTLKAMEAAAKVMTERMVTVDTWGGLFFTLVLIALVPAVGEELFFRGIIQQLLQSKMGAHLAVWTTALIFSFIHFQFYGFIPRMLLGAWLGYLLVWGGSLWYPVIAHFINNATVVLFYFADRKGWISIDLETLGDKATSMYGYLSIITVAMLLAILQRRFYKLKRKSGPAFPDNE